MTSNVDSSGGFAPEPLEVQLRRAKVRPIQSADDLACDGLFETDAEVTEFLPIPTPRAGRNLSRRLRPAGVMRLR